MARLSPSTYDAVREGTIKSACTVLPMLAETLGQPTGLLDVGCGEGHWLDAAEALWGPLDCMGLDVEAGRTPDGLVIERWDAEAGQPIPHSSTRRWPLALCLEMAEHVSPEAGEHLVAELCRVSERVVFSAAIPGQGGVGHVNEQWPCYWADKFAGHDYVGTGRARERVWDDDRLEPWYRQNLLIFSDHSAVLTREFGAWNDGCPALVHPDIWSIYRR